LISAPLDDGYIRLIDMGSGELIDLPRAALLEAMESVDPEALAGALDAGEQVGNWSFLAALRGVPVVLMALNSCAKDAMLASSAIDIGLVAECASFDELGPDLRIAFARAEGSPLPESGRKLT